MPNECENSSNSYAFRQTIVQTIQQIERQNMNSILSDKTYRLYIEVIIISIAILLAFTSSLLLQEPIKFNNGLGWDGEKYHQIATQMLNNQEISSKAPFVYRVGTPWLSVELFGADLKNSFVQLNTIFALFLPFFVYYFIKSKFINSGLATLAALIYIGFWHSPLNFLNFYPYYVDPAALFFLFLGIIISTGNLDLKYKVILLTLTSGLGTIFREIAAIPAIVFYLNYIIHQADIKSNFAELFSKATFAKLFANDSLIRLIPTIISAIVYFTIVLNVTPTNSYKFWNAALDVFYNKSLVNYLHSLLIAYGPIVFIAFFNLKSLATLLRANKIEALYLYIFLILALIGGADTERIAFFGAPIVFFFLAKLVELDEVKNLTYFSVLVATMIISMRLFLALPTDVSDVHTYPIITQFSLDFSYLDLYASHADNKVKLVSFLEYCGIFLLLYYSRKIKKIRVD